VSAKLDGFNPQSSRAFSRFTSHFSRHA